MREIKFRAWDTYANAMISWEELIEDNELSVLDDPSYHTTQYTGLKDKNGKEIYEGDIINDLQDGWLNKEVIFYKGCFCIKIAEKQYHIFNERKTEVIGNIYENKELLNN